MGKGSISLSHYALHFRNFIGCLVVCMDPDTTGVGQCKTHAPDRVGLTWNISPHQVGLTQTHSSQFQIHLVME